MKTTRESKLYLTLFLVTCLGGAVRKWFVSSAAMGNAVLMLQMILPFVMVIYRSPKAVSPFPQFKVLYFFFFYLAFHVIYPLQLTPWHGVLGIVIYGGIWLGIFFYFANRHLFRPQQFIYTMLIVAAAEIVLGFIQYNLPPDNFLNRYAMMGEGAAVQQVALVNNKVRITGTFSYISGYNAFMLFYTLFVWALVRLRFNSWIIGVGLVFGMIASFMSGSRSGTLLYLMFVVPMVIKEFPPQELVRFVRQMAIPMTVGFAVLLLMQKIPLLDQINEAYNNFFDRVEQNRASGEEAGRLTWDLWYFQADSFKYPLFGIGTAATYQGAQALFGISPHVYEFGYVEGELVKVMLEGGVVLLAFKVILSTMLVMNLSFKDKLARFMIWVILVYAAPIVFNQHNASFMLLGLILIDNIIWRQDEERKRKVSDEQQLTDEDNQEEDVADLAITAS